MKRLGEGKIAATVQVSTIQKMDHTKKDNTMKREIVGPQRQ
jgi:hypothetical protein